jgi:uncharacterized membrane protein HdeD (DUF308 family)
MGPSEGQDVGFVLDGKEKWWVKLILGLLGVIFGIIFILMPGVPWLTLAILVGAFLMLFGFVFLFGGLVGEGAKGKERWLAVLVGIIGVLAGMIAVVFPGLTTLIVLVILGVWLILLGVTEMIGDEKAQTAAGETKGLRALRIITGVLDIAIGFIFIMVPVAGGVVVAWFAGLLLLILGMMYIYLAITNKNVEVPKVDAPKM